MAVATFNKLLGDLLSQLPTINGLQKHIMTLQSAVIMFDQTLQKHPSQPIATFQEKYKLFELSAAGPDKDKDKDSLARDFLLKEGKSILGIDLTSEWKGLGKVTQSSLILYIQKLASLADTWSQERLVDQGFDLKQMEQQMGELLHACLSGDYSKLSAKDKKVIEQTKMTIADLETTRGRPFDLSLDSDRLEFDVTLQQLKKNVSS
jgi:hypothetical protein